MIDLNDERSARKVIDNVYRNGNEEVKEVALSILADGIKEANIYGRHRWTVRVEETARLVVGHYYVCTVRESGVWIALDDRFTKSGEYYPTMDELNAMGWTPDEEGKKDHKRTYSDKSRRNPFSVNGLYSIGADHDKNWPHIRRLFFDFIYKAIHHGQRMDKDSPGLHSQGMLKYLRHYLGVELPDPFYEADAR